MKRTVLACAAICLSQVATAQITLEVAPASPQEIKQTISTVDATEENPNGTPNLEKPVDIAPVEIAPPEVVATPVLQATTPVPTPAPLQTGVASYYGKWFHGRKTANGEIFNMTTLTAAHPTLPFGTLLKVTNTHNNESVVVRINDRGPYKGQRIIDLSQAAAAKIGMIGRGLASVVLEIFKP